MDQQKTDTTLVQNAADGAMMEEQPTVVIHFEDETTAIELDTPKCNGDECDATMVDVHLQRLTPEEAQKKNAASRTRSREKNSRGEGGNQRGSLKFYQRVINFFTHRKESIIELRSPGKSAKYSHLELDANPEIPRPLPDLQTQYQKLEMFAETSISEVYAISDRNLGRTAAAKVLKVEAEKSELLVRNFLTESKIIAQLDHSAIIPLYTLNQDEQGRIYQVMKLINGRNLSVFLKNTVLNYYLRGRYVFDEKRALSDRLEIFIQVCNAVAYAHSKKIIHRDLRCENIMIGEFMSIYVTGWHLACPVPEGARFVETKEFMKEIASRSEAVNRYLAPEVLQRNQWGYASDLYALGVILREIVTLRSPDLEHIAENQQERTCWKHWFRCSEKNYSLLKHRFGLWLDRDLQAIIRKATHPDAARRYESVGAFAEDIRRNLASLEVEARRRSILGKIVLLLLRYRRSLFFALLVLVMAASAIAGYTVYRNYRAIVEANYRNDTINRTYWSVVSFTAQLNMGLRHIQDQLLSAAVRSTYVFQNHTIFAPGKKTAFYALDGELSQVPEDMAYSPVYHQQIAMRNGLYKVAAGADPAEVQQVLRYGEALLDPLRMTMLQSSVGSFYNSVTRLELERRAFDKGLPVKSVFIGSAAGVQFSFPWREEFQADFDPRQRVWYQDALNSNGPHWGRPYVDADGLGLSLPCSMALLDEEGTLHGVIGLDLSLTHLAEQLKAFGTEGDGVLERALITPGGEIFYSDQEDFLKFSTERLVRSARGEMAAFPLFKSSELRKKFQEEQKNQQGFFFYSQYGNQELPIEDLQKKGQERLVCFAYLKLLNLYYVEIIDVAALLDGSRDGHAQRTEVLAWEMQNDIP